MKNFFGFVLALVMLCTCYVATAQITNLTVNGATTTFSITSGDTIRWQYNINPVGATVNGELWYNVNQNGVIDTAVDKQFLAFRQTDGDTNGNGGPPDMDGLANGHVLFYQPIGFAPGKYIFKLSYNSDVHIVTGTMLPLLSPSHTISGTVTPPLSMDPRYIFVQVKANTHGNSDKSWDAITDSAGNFTIAMSADTSGNPWDVRFADQYNPFPPSIPNPSDYSITISAPSYGGMNFGFLVAAAQVAGYLKDENQIPLPGQSVEASRSDGGVNRQSKTNVSGFFQIGLQSSELTTQTWQLQSDCNCNNGVTGNDLIALAQLPMITSGESLNVALTVYYANSQITGRVTFNGNPPQFPLMVLATNMDTAQAQTWSDSATGNFTLNVSDKIRNYSIFVTNTGLNAQQQNIVAHAGQTGVIVNLTTTSVEQHPPGIPTKVALGQNYPNPFNPTTVINYELPKEEYVHLVVYDMLGREVATLVNGMQQAGSKSIEFNAASAVGGLPSGLYFYRMTAGSFSETKKLLYLR